MSTTHYEIRDGITYRRRVRIDKPVDKPFDAADLDGIIKSLEASTFDSRLASIEDLARGVLRNADLPDHLDEVRVHADGKWSPLPKKRKNYDLTELCQPGERISEVLSLVKHSQFSPQWYAANCLNLVNRVKHCINTNDSEGAANFGLKLGILSNEANLKLELETDALRGQKVITDARAGHVGRHGTDEEKLARWKDYVEMYDDHIKSGHRKMLARELTAIHFGVCLKTISRAEERLR